MTAHQKPLGIAAVVGNRSRTHPSLSATSAADLKVLNPKGHGQDRVTFLAMAMAVNK